MPYGINSNGMYWRTDGSCGRVGIDVFEVVLGLWIVVGGLICGIECCGGAYLCALERWIRSTMPTMIMVTTMAIGMLHRHCAVFAVAVDDTVEREFLEVG